MLKLAIYTTHDTDHSGDRTSFDTLHPYEVREAVREFSARGNYLIKGNLTPQLLAELCHCDIGLIIAKRTKEYDYLDNFTNQFIQGKHKVIYSKVEFING